MLPQSEFDSPMFTSAPAPVAISALTQDRALIGLLRSVIDPTTELILVSSEAELEPHLNSRRVSVALLDSMFIEGDLAALSERLRDTWPDLVLVVVGTAEEQSKVASQITSGVVYRFLHRPVSAPRVRLFVEAALRRHEIENVERTLEQVQPDFSRFEAPKTTEGAPRAARPAGPGLPRFVLPAIAVLVLAGGAWMALRGFSGGDAPSATAQADGKADGEAGTVDSPASQAAAQAPAPADVASEPVSMPQPTVAAVPAPAVAAEPPAEETQTASSAQPGAAHLLRTEETAVEAPETAALPPPPVLTHEQRLREALAQAEAALQRGELASPPERNAVELFRGALELDPGNTLAKGGLVRVADRLLSAAERALTAGNAEDARKMVDVAEGLTPATARGAFLMMQIDMERERAALTAKRNGDTQDRLEKGALYLRLANARLRSGALIEPSEDNARFYLEAARQLVPEDAAVTEVSRTLQKELLTRAAAAASSGNAAETERWLANADAAEAPRAEMTAIRRMLQDTLIQARTAKVDTLAQSFNAALAANRLIEPENASAKAYLFDLIDADASHAAVAASRQGLGAAYLRELRAALARADVAAADAWLLEARTISFASADLNAAESELGQLRKQVAQRRSVVGAGELTRVTYVAPEFPARSFNSVMEGYVDIEFTVRTDGTTGDIVVTNSSPRRVFDSAATTAVRKWRYQPVMLGGKPVEQRAAVRIRFTEN